MSTHLTQRRPSEARAPDQQDGLASPSAYPIQALVGLRVQAPPGRQVLVAPQALASPRVLAGLRVLAPQGPRKRQAHGLATHPP